MSIELKSIRKRFGDFTALDGIDLAIAPGELVALLGPSGSGKTTLLRIIAGLEWADLGELLLDEENASRRSARERRIGFVFQHYALFRHLTVFENVAFGLRVRPRRQRPNAATIKATVERLLDLVQLRGLAARFPNQLSGGQRQRVALARALAIEPRVLLLDEPFGALDAKVRKDLRRWLRRLHEELGTTTVFVTHDQEEAMELADRVVVMSQGRIEQIGTPSEVYARPRNPFVYRFLGQVNEVPARIVNGRALVPGIAIDAVEDVGELEGEAVLYVRPQDIAVTPDPVGAARIRYVAVAGPYARLEIEMSDSALLLESEIAHQELTTRGLKAGDRVSLRFRHARPFDRPAEFALGNAAEDSRLSSSL